MALKLTKQFQHKKIPVKGCCIINPVVKSVLFGGSGGSASALFCYQLFYQTNNINDTLDSIETSEGSVVVGISLSDTEANIVSAIQSALSGAGIAYSSISVTKTDLGGGIWDIAIVILLINVTVTSIIIHHVGFGSTSTLTDLNCDLVILDSDSLPILDSNGLALISS